MRWALRFALSASVLAFLLLVLLKNHLEDLWDQYDVTSYIGASWKNTFKHGTVQNIPAFNGQPGDKVIIMATLEKENTDWVAEGLPDWQAAIYTVNPTHNLTTGLTTPMNKRP
ncbi:hypothetical protein ABVK25_008757 [Lepraria finkii]|uniref:Uncharacterized protein n=1 Tax=Lepraria finkii TaxID=1340010 RepID=A0ABR4AZC7_9LECA